MPGIRINKYISQSGYCSRRKADELIEAGRVVIDGRKAKLGDSVGPDDLVIVDGNPIDEKAENVYIVLNKPYGVITTMDKEADNSVGDYVRLKIRLYPVGRLDVESSGLLLMTNDGDFANRISKAGNIEKEYIVTVHKTMTDPFMQEMRNGVKLDGQKVVPVKFQKIGPNKFKITLTQGKNRQVRRMCESMGYKVRTLTRVRIDSIELEKLPRGKWRFLEDKEVKSLLQ